MNSKKLLTLTSCSLSVFLAVAMAVVPMTAHADDLKIDVAQEGAVKSALQALTGKSVTVSTDSGEPITGVVDSIGPDSVKIVQLSGKEFFSAVVKLGAIVSVVYRGK